MEGLLKEASFLGVSLLNEDRILVIALEKKKDKFLLIFELCFKHPRIVLTTPSFQILESWEPLSEKVYLFPKAGNKPPVEQVTVDSQSIAVRYQAMEEKAQFQQRVSSIERQLLQRFKKAEGRVDLHRKEIEEAKQWQDLAHIGELLKSHYHSLKKGMSSITLEDWELAGETRKIPLDPLLSPQEIIKRHFKQLRKLQKRGEVAELLLSKAQAETDALKGFVHRLKAAVSLKELDALALEAHLIDQQPKEKRKKEENKHPYREFITEAGIHIFVGRKDLDNDRLSFSFAHGSDLWFHAANTAGSHVVLKVSKGSVKRSVVDEESIQDALQLALHFSKARERNEDEVTMTECKFLSKTKGSKPGQVNVSKHKTVRVRLDPKRLQRLLGKLI